MRAKTAPHLPAVFFVAVVAGCAARPRIAGTGPPFRLGAVYGRAVLFPPSIPESTPNDAAISAQTGANAPATQERDCAVESGPFRVRITNGVPTLIEVALPSADRWISDIRGIVDADGDAIASLYDVFGTLDQPQQSACFAENVSVIRDFILQSLPMEPAETLFNFYGYRSSRSGIDLKPGMRLKVERAYLKADSGGEQPAPSANNQEGVSSGYFQVSTEADGRIQFRREGDARFVPASIRNKFQAIARESELAALAPESGYRLVFYGLHVPTDQKLSASIIGASSAAQLDRFEAELRSNPAAGCRIFSGVLRPTCLDFAGWVTVTPQASVRLNGKTRFVDCGTSLREVLPDGALGSLKVQRKFLNSYRDLVFKPGDTSVLSLALVGGDRLSW